MKKSSPSAPVSPGRKSTAPGPFIETDMDEFEDIGPGRRRDVRQESHRGNVPRQSERPPERSKPRRSRRPA